MRTLTRLALAALVLAAAALGALAIVLPRYVKSDAVRAKLETAAVQSLEREVSYADLDVWFFPPSLVVVGPRVAGPTPQAPPALEAEEVALELAWAPLLARKLVIESLRVEGAKLRLARSAQGVELPLPPGASEPREPGSEQAEPGEGFSLAVRELNLRGAKLLFEDRAVSPPVTWNLSGVDVRLRGVSSDEPFDVEVEVEMAGGGRLSGRGSASLDAQVALEFELDAFPVDVVAPYLGDAEQLSGTLTGKVSARGNAADPDPVAFDLVLRDGQVRFEDLTLIGRASVKGEITGGLRAPKGRFEADATHAEVRFAEIFAKPPGSPAAIKGLLVTRPDGRLGVDDLQVKVEKVEAHGKAELGDRSRRV